jgi:hypothetical protein
MGYVISLRADSRSATGIDAWLSERRFLSQILYLASCYSYLDAVVLVDFSPSRYPQSDDPSVVVSTFKFAPRQQPLTRKVEERKANISYARGRGARSRGQDSASRYSQRPTREKGRGRGREGGKRGEEGEGRRERGERREDDRTGERGEKMHHWRLRVIISTAERWAMGDDNE